MVGRDGKIYDLSKGEHPTYNYDKRLATINKDDVIKLPKDALCVTQEECERMKKKRGQTT